MTFMRKFLDMLNMEKWEVNKENNSAISNVPKQNDYYAKLDQQKKNNLRISYKDVEQYNMKPFDLNKPFISDGDFTAIALEGNNLEKAYLYLEEIHKILFPLKNLYENAIFPTKIGVDYAFRDPKCSLPVSYLHLTPYTATMKESKYPFFLCLSYFSDYGFDYYYLIYFDQIGIIGKCDLHLHGSNGARLSYETKIRRNERGLYVKTIRKTLYVEPYGTKIIYDVENAEKIEKSVPIRNPERNKKQKKNYSKYDVERYAAQCNAFVVREERREQDK